MVAAAHIDGDLGMVEPFKSFLELKPSLKRGGAAVETISGNKQEIHLSGNGCINNVVPCQKG